MQPAPQRRNLPIPIEGARAVWVLLGLNVLMFIVANGLAFFEPVDMAACGRFLVGYDCALLRLGWKDNLLIFQREYWRLLAATFLHSGLLHIGFNGVALYVLGPQTEQVYGTARFLAIYFVAGLAGSIASYAFSPAPSVGASGSIFGVIGALAIFYYATRQLLGEAGRQRLQGMVFIIVINLLIGFGSGGTIDNFGHIGGLLGGVAVGWLLVPRYEVRREKLSSFSSLAIHRLVRYTNSASWAGVAALLLALVVLAVSIHPPL